MAIKEECCYIGRGEIFLKKCLTEQEIADGVVAEFESVGNTENFSITSEVNTITKKNYISKCGGIECTYSSLDDIQINLTLCCYKDLNIGLAMGSDCIVVPALAEVPAAPVTLTQTVATNYVNIPIIPEIDPAIPYTVLVNGIDVTADFEIVAGELTYVGGEPLVDLDAVEFNYTSLFVAATPEQKKFNLFSCTSDVYELEFRGCNAAKGSENTEWNVNLYQVCFEPASEFQFLTEEFGTIELVGRLLPDRTRSINDGTTTFPSEYGSICISQGA